MYLPLALLVVTQQPSALPVSAGSSLLRVLAITDLHGALEPRRWQETGNRLVGGVAALKPWLDSLDRECGCGVVRLDGGDEMQGTPISNFSYGRSTIEALNALGIDAAAIGNHEFDWSVDTLRARMAAARYRFVSANITDSTGDVRPEWVEPWTVITRAGLRVAVIGLTTLSTPTSTAPRNVRGLAFGDEAAAIRRYLPPARRAADFVIVAAHEGAACDPTACRGEILEVARQLDSGSVDLIVAGHTHRLVNTVVNGIPVVEAGSSGRAIAVVDFGRVSGGRREVRARLVTPFADVVKPDPGLSALLDTYRRAITSVTGRPVATFGAPLTRAGPEYPLGRLIADAQRVVGKADVGIMNNGGIRADLAAGVATFGDLYQVQPFQNRLLRLAVSGAVLLQVLEHAVAGEHPDAHLSGVEVWYDDRRPPGHRIERTRLAAGAAIDPRRTYVLAASDFLATGGSGFAMLRGVPSEDTGLTDLDALIAYLGMLRKPIAAPTDSRIHAAAR